MKPIVWLGQLCDYWETTKNNKWLPPQRHVNGWSFWWKLWDVDILGTRFPDGYNTICTHQFLTKKAPVQLWYGEKWGLLKKILGTWKIFYIGTSEERSIFLLWFWLTRAILPFPKWQPAPSAAWTMPWAGSTPTAPGQISFSGPNLERSWGTKSTAPIHSALKRRHCEKEHRWGQVTTDETDYFPKDQWALVWWRFPDIPQIFLMSSVVPRCACCQNTVYSFALEPEKQVKIFTSYLPSQNAHRAKNNCLHEKARKIILGRHEDHVPLSKENLWDQTWLTSRNVFPLQPPSPHLPKTRKSNIGTEFLK